MSKEVVCLGIMIIIVLGQALMMVIGYWRYLREKTTPKNEFYTDYVRGSLILRVYRYEFEFQAIGDVKSYEILDGGNMSALYKWALLKRRNAK
jgi:hypothetical protein